MRRVFGHGHVLMAEIRRTGRTKKYVAETMGIPYRTLDQWTRELHGMPEAILRGILATFPEFNKKLFHLDSEAPNQQKLPLSPSPRPKRKGAAG